MLSSNRMQLDGRRARLIPQPRSDCPINRSLEMLGDRWSLLILRDIVLHDRRSFRELLTGSEEGISAPCCLAGWPTWLRRASSPRTR